MTKSNAKDPKELIARIEEIRLSLIKELTRQQVQCLHDNIVRRKNFINTQQKSFGRVTDAQSEDLRVIDSLIPLLQHILNT